MAIYLLQGVMLALPTVLTPSPFRIYLITEVLQHGFRRTLPAIFAPAITDGPIILLVVLILSRMPQWMLDALRFGGGLYLLYLATNVVRLLRRTTGPTLRGPADRARQSLGRAVVVNALNPNPYIFWTVVAGPILMLGLAQSLATGLAFLLGFYGVFFVGVTIVIWLFSAAGRINSGREPAAARRLGVGAGPHRPHADLGRRPPGGPIGRHRWGKGLDRSDMSDMSDAIEIRPMAAKDLPLVRAHLTNGGTASTPNVWRDRRGETVYLIAWQVHDR